ncbi:MAG TPA: hypothetical protein VG895_04770 [Patescibacteria group bacterium]|nr:hypothetical protein [Patescibacteria group bacterium]
MNIPFTPASFRKLDILQQLMEYESHKKEKSLWNGVKAVLIWAASVHHQHLGSYIGPNHVKSALDYCRDEKFISEDERNRLVNSCSHILQSLPVYGFGDEDPNSNQSVKINRNGVLAGRILVETNFLKNTWLRYKVWIVVWWIILIAASVILISQVISTLKNISGVSLTDNYTTQYTHQLQGKHRFYHKRKPF